MKLNDRITHLHHKEYRYLIELHLFRFLSFRRLQKQETNKEQVLEEQ